ncbi:hypothetical protein M378DRAFT_181648 [Amanita muscaria Koide BX008]|uniref:Uncharacterized protein n=1 Tax=Amanita muscaria (strain Koide BX008) TaxID=946122 RepID=A0A0C2STL2_AMAMK|nr:hypothetical protein M378DRAFT_181648 [Amanita muscaria Koide BX008]
MSVLQRLNPNPNPNPDDELSVEELLALVSDGSAGASTGASAWERDDVGCCTVKCVGDVDLNVDRREEKKLTAEGPPMSPPPPPSSDELVARQISPTTTTTERELELVQEMSETREKLRVLEEEEDRDRHKPPQGQSLPGRIASMLRTVFGASVQGDGVGASLVRMVLPFSSPPSSHPRVV